MPKHALATVAALSLLLSGCVVLVNDDDTDGQEGADSSSETQNAETSSDDGTTAGDGDESGTGDGDDDTSETGDGDGDGADSQSGDGDGGAGDGDSSGSGDGDTSGSGDGDSSGTGDGDGSTSEETDGGSGSGGDGDTGGDGLCTSGEDHQSAPFDCFAKLLAADGAGADEFGYSISIASDYVAVGVPGAASGQGAVYIYYRDAGGANAWGELAKVVASDGAAGDAFGSAIAITTSYLWVGAPGDADGAGSAYVFGVDEGGLDEWGEIKKVSPAGSASSDAFGSSVALSGDLAIVGAPGESSQGPDTGAAYVFEQTFGGLDNWGERQELQAGSGAAGDAFGTSVAISGTLAVVGASGDDDAGSGSGSVYVFAQDTGGASNWGQTAKFDATDAAAGDAFGTAVALSGEILVVGAPDGGGSGAAYLFGLNEGGSSNWGEITKLTASDGAADDAFGVAVAIDPGRVVVGAAANDDDGTDSGAAYFFKVDEGGLDNWGEVTKLLPADGEAEDFFGSAVAVSGELVGVTSPGEDTSGAAAGAAYLRRFE